MIYVSCIHRCALDKESLGNDYIKKKKKKKEEKSLAKVLDFVILLNIVFMHAPYPISFCP